MKKLILIATILLLPSVFNLLSLGDCWSGVSFAQVYPPPEGINYQAIARDTTGKPISSSVNLVVRFTIWPDNSGTGASIFTETHSPVNTNRYGLFTLVIGSANNTAFQNIIWALGDKFLEVEIATVGGSSYISMGKTQMMSVPYALHSKTSLYSYGNWAVSGNDITNPADFIGTTNPADLLIKTNNTEKMIVKSAGNVGIGTSTPMSKLDVAGGISIGSAYSGITAAPANGAIIEGNVGIGTSSPDPASKLDLAGQIKITGGNPGTNKVLTSDASGLAAWTVADTGTVISFSADSLAPLFSTTVTTPTTTPALSFALSNAAPYTLFGNNSGVSTAPAYFIPTLASSLFQNQGTVATVLHGNATGAPSWGQIVNADIANGSINLATKVSGILPIVNGGTNTNTLGLAGSIPYSNTTATAYGFSAVGASGQVLTSGGTGAPTWTTPTTGTVTSVTGIAPIFSTGGVSPAISVVTNSQSSPGVVTAGGSNNDMVWKTNGFGAPAWRNDSSASYFAGTGLILSGNTFSSVWTQLGINIYNNNAGNVGIGISVPTAKLHITPTGAVVGLNSSTLGTGSSGIFENFNASNSSSTLVGRTNGSGNAIFAMNTGTWRAGTFTINNAANINEALYVESNGSGNTMYGLNTNTGRAGAFQVLNIASTADALYVTTNGSNSKGLNVLHTGAVAGSTNYGAYISNTGAGSGATNIAGYFSATGGANNYAGIFAQGNVGIGTIAPAQRLTINYTGGGVAPLLISSPGSAGNTFSITSDHRLLYSPTVTGAGVTLVNFGSNLSNVTTSGSFMTINPLSVDASSNVLNILEGGTSRLIVNGDGNVGIGTTTPGAGLVVSGSGIWKSAIGIQNTTAGMEWRMTTANDGTFNIVKVTGSTFTAMTINSTSGNVGIGTTSPSAILNIQGSGINNFRGIQVQNTFANNTIKGADAIIGARYNNANTPFAAFGAWDDNINRTVYIGGGSWSMPDATSICFFTAPAYDETVGAPTNIRMIIDNAGNVGIGTTAPATNARLAIKDGHLQSQQTTAPTVIAVTTFVMGSQSLSNATDVAGNISILTTAAAGSVTIDFNKDYSIAPIVILTPTNEASANDIEKVWVTTTATTFTINFNNVGGVFPPIASVHTFSYHVIETTSN